MRINLTRTRGDRCGIGSVSGTVMRAIVAILLTAALLATPVAAAPVESNSYIPPFTPVPLSRGPSEAQLLWSRLKAGLPSELYSNFDLFIYVNKAEQGPWSQHLYAFAKPSGGSPGAEMILMMDSPASTGREDMERAKDGQLVSTETPAGYFEFDPERFEPGHRSRQWQQDMPNAMFFNWVRNGVRSGLAIHGVTDAPSVSALGHRASAGCVQLPLDVSRQLFDLVRDGFEGKVPRFAFDAASRTTSSSGAFARDDDGNIIMDDGYRALLIIEDIGNATLTSQLSVRAAANSG